jgi:hypothetical protein
LNLDISHLTEVSAKTWEDLLESSDDVWLWHSLDWIETTAKVFSLENHYFLAQENGRTLGALPLQVHWKTRRGQCVWAGRGGPFCIRGLPSITRDHVLKQLTEAVVNWAREVKIRSIACSLPPLAYNNLQNIRGVNPLTFVGWQDVSAHTRIATLSRPESDLWMELSHDARQQIKRARSAGYVAHRTNWREMLDDYYRVSVETYRRTGNSPYDKAFFEAVVRMSDQGHEVLWVGRDPNGEAIAFHDCARYRDGSFYFSGCCETEHLRSGIGYLLFWEALVGAKTDGCQWYEIGEVYPELAEAKQKGLTIFKQKFGGELYRVYRGQITLSKNQPQLVQMLSSTIQFGKRQLKLRGVF